MGHESQVGVLLEKSAELVAVLLGVLKAGGAYLPLDPSYPLERLKRMATEVEVLVSHGAVAAALSGHRQVVDLDLAAFARCPDSALGLPVSADGLAYVMFTSGTTGEPKGIAVPHRGVVRLVREVYYARFGPGEVFLHLAPISFDASTLEIWGALLHGGQLALLAERTPSLEELGRCLERHGVTTLWLTAGLFHQVMDTCPWILCGLRQLLAGGDALSLPHVRRALELLPGVRLINGYGPTEGTTFTCCAYLSAASCPVSVPIGRPIANTRIYLVDRRGRAVPMGVAGELWIGGDGLARGYLGRAELTADRFVPDPFGGRGGRLYRTGDLARYRADGELEILGRIDQQVKVRGFRIEPGEIETILLRSSAVEQAVVTVREDRPGDKRLVAYLAMRPGATLEAGRLRELLASQLPQYMVPGELVVLDKLPLTPNGKVDRKALPAPEAARGGEGFVAPRAPAEQLMAGIWCDVLGVERVGLAENFFELGGHSLLATQVVSRLRDAFGVELALRELFAAPTVASLAGRVEAALRGGEEGAGLVAVAPLVRVSREEPLPLSFAQERLWFLDQLEPGGSPYGVPAAVRVSGALDGRVFAAALDEIARRHESLRTTFASVQGRPVQVVAPPLSLAVPVVDLRALPGDLRDAAAQGLARSEAARPFDLARGPLVRVVLVALAPEEHLALLTLHHIVSDGWSMGVLVRELTALYPTFAAGRASPLLELPIQYADFAVWQRGWLAGEALEVRLAHWRHRLAGAPALLELPTDRPRPAVQGFQGGRLAVALPAERLAELGRLSRRQGVTLFMTLLAAFDVLLHRFSGVEDVVVGSPIANRNRVETEPLIGFFVNTLALRADLREDPEFLRLLKQVRETTLEAYAHQDLPFEKLVEEIAPQRSLSHTPVFQVVFVLQNAPLGSLELPGLRLEPVAVETGQAKFDLTLSLAETEAGVAGSFEYRTELFDASTMVRLAEQWAVLLAGVAAGPELAVGDLPLLPPAERLQVLSMGMATAYPREACIHELFAAQAAERPEALALVWDGGAVTYGELDRWSNQIAHRLRDLGVGPESLVGVLLESGVELVAVLLGILKAGGAYLPLNPSYPLEWLERMAAEVGVLVARGSLAAVVLAGGRRVLDLAQAEAIAGCPDTALEVPVCADGLAYVLFTSGTTGVPKGIAVPHRGVVRLVRETAYAWFGPAEVFLHIAPISFDASTFEIWGALLHGARLALPAERMPSLEELGQGLERHGVTTLWLTAGLFHQVMDACPWILRGLRQLLAGGDALSLPHVRRALAELPGVRLINGYGPTEGTTFTCCAELSVTSCRYSVPIGRPIANTRICLVDRRGRAVPVGAPGELWIGGDGLARGYLARPDLTAERFVPDPFGGGGGRLYRTGDLVRRRADGDIEFLGRIDQQVKVRGFRIEPGEIEAALLRSPAVEQAAVIVREDRPGDKRLVAYVAVRSGRTLDAGSLRDLLASQLPSYMVPSAWVALEALPLTPNGKVDRRALPPPGPEEEAGTAEAPRTPFEEVVAGLWVELLGVESAGRGSHFFAMGGHSLLATRAISRVRTVFGIDLPLHVLFEAPTVAGFAARVEEALGAAPGPGEPPLQRASRDGDLPLSFSQQRLWFLDRLQPGDPVYNIPAAFRLAGRLAAGAFEAAFREVVRRHEVLRTRFAEGGGEPRQVIDRDVPLAVPRIDLAGLAPVRREEELARLAREEALLPFDLARGPVLRVRLVRLDPEEHAALVTVHHIAADGWSMGVLVREIAAVYESCVTDMPSTLPELPLQVADFAVWQRERLRGERLAAELAWWRESLADAPAALPLPIDRPRPPMPSSRGAVRALRLPAELAGELAALGRREGATLFMTLLAAFAVLLQRWTGEDDLPVGTPVAGRTRAELEGLIGFFVNTLVLRAGLAGDPPYRELLARVRTISLGAYAHQDLPFERLVEELLPARDLSHNPLFQVMFALQNAPRPDLRLAGLEVQPVPAGEVRAKLDLSLTLEETPAGLEGSFEYATDLFDAATVERFAGHLRSLLAGVAAGPDCRLSDLPLLEENELAQLLADRDDPGLPEGRCVHHLFAEQAARTPGAVALVSGDRQVTYEELAGLARDLAGRLAAAGAGPGDLVAIQLRRSVEASAAMLGILQAGAAYLPLDPSAPRQRLDVVLEDARPRFLLAAGEADGVRLDVLDPVPSPVPGSAAGPDDLAYVLYTSGSTGRPKGVLVPHRALARHALAMARRYELAADDRVLQLASLTFDVAAEELYPSWIRGAAVVLEPEEVPAPTEAFRRFVERERLTVLNLPSSFFEGWVSTLAEAASPPPPLLRLLIVGSEPVPERALEAWRGLAGSRVRTLNGYGLTESTITSSLWEMAGLPPSGRVPIGRPVEGAEMLVLDPWGNPAPLGIAGELSIGGAGLALGYLGHPALTAERFVPHPFPLRMGERLLRTGDLARRLPDGDFEVLGRIDRQVKVRGFRIEPGEVEAALAAHPEVREAAVVAHEDGRGGRRLVAYVTPRGERPPQAASLRAHLQGLLPAAMIPAAWVVLPALPRSASGKVDRRALPLPEEAAGSLSGSPSGVPRSPVEELLAGIWEEVLGLEGVGVEDDFFALGGHSLAATRLVSRIREALGVELPLRRIFETPTPAGLAAAVEAQRAAGQAAVAPPILPLAPASRRGELPISFAQQRIWLVDRTAGGESPFYNQPAAVELRGLLQPAALAAAFAEIVRRHEALRTSFVLRGDRLVQVVGESRTLLPVVDLAALPESAREAEALRLAGEEARRPFDLARGPLLRLGLLRLGEDRHILLFTIHHIAGDGWSMGVLVREVAALYPAFTEGRPSPLPDLPVQYADYAAWQRGWLRGEALETHLSYWRRALAGSPASLDLPADRPRREELTGRGARRSFRIPGALHRELRSLCRSEKVTLFMLLLAAFDVLLHRASGQDDLVVGAAVAGRNHSEVEGLVGCFINLLPLRVSLAGDPTFRELLARVREVTLGAFAHQDLPLELLASELRWERATGGRPLVQVAFGVQNTPDHPAELPGLDLRVLDLDPGMARFELTLWITEEAGGLTAAWTWSTDLFAAATVERLYGRFEALLGRLAADPAARLSTLEVLTAAEQERKAERLRQWQEAKTGRFARRQRRPLS